VDVDDGFVTFALGAAMKKFLLLVLLLAACGRTYVRTAPGFVEVKHDPTYDFRAIAPDGVAVAVRRVDVDDKTDLAFWERAVLLRTRELEGYALLASTDVRSSDGTAGRELVFGHDEQGKPFEYRMRLFMNGSKLVLAEAGGAKENMDRWRTSVDWMLSSVRAN
jgi:hypothetical protein